MEKGNIKRPRTDEPSVANAINDMFDEISTNFGVGNTEEQYLNISRRAMDTFVIIMDELNFDVYRQMILADAIGCNYKYTERVMVIKR